MDTTTHSEDLTLTVGSIAASDYRKAAVFQQYGIDFCCGGGITLAEACRKAGIGEEKILDELESAVATPVNRDHDFLHRDLTELCDHIVGTHHRYVREQGPVLMEYSRKVAMHHGNNHPSLLHLEAEIRGTLNDLYSHMDREEKVLFPAIRHLARLKNSGEGGHGAEFQFIRQCVEKMRGEHTASGGDLEKIRELTNNYTLPEGACNSYRFLFQQLLAFEQDLQRHIHLENNILFPRAIALLDV